MPVRPRAPRPRVPDAPTRARRRPPPAARPRLPRLQQDRQDVAAASSSSPATARAPPRARRRSRARPPAIAMQRRLDCDPVDRGAGTARADLAAPHSRDARVMPRIQLESRIRQVVRRRAGALCERSARRRARPAGSRATQRTRPPAPRSHRSAGRARRAPRPASIAARISHGRRVVPVAPPLDERRRAERLGERPVSLHLPRRRPRRSALRARRRSSRAAVSPACRITSTPPIAPGAVPTRRAPQGSSVCTCDPEGGHEHRRRGCCRRGSASAPLGASRSAASPSTRKLVQSPLARTSSCARPRRRRRRVRGARESGRRHRLAAPGRERPRRG